MRRPTFSILVLAAALGWLGGAPMPEARTEVAAAVVRGEIVVVGGLTADGTPSPRVDAYSPSADRWRRLPDLPAGLHHTLAASDGRRLYVVGGYGDPLGGGGRYAVESYLDHHAEKLIHRFDANSYVVLTEAMNSHDIGRGRGGVPAALRRIRAVTAVAGIDSDRLYPLPLNAELAEGIEGASLTVMSSPHGHDGFLVESAQVGGIVARLLDERSLCACS